MKIASAVALLVVATNVEGLSLLNIFKGSKGSKFGMPPLPESGRPKAIGTSSCFLTLLASLPLIELGSTLSACSWSSQQV